MFTLQAGVKCRESISFIIFEKACDAGRRSYILAAEKKEKKGASGFSPADTPLPPQLYIHERLRCRRRTWEKKKRKKPCTDNVVDAARRLFLV